MPEKLPIPSGEKNPKSIFLIALEKELTSLQQAGRITPEQVEQKRAAAWKMEDGFSKDPAYDAKYFANAGINEERQVRDFFGMKW